VRLASLGSSCIYFHGCYSLVGDQLWGVLRERKGGDHALAALQSIRARPARRLLAVRHRGQPVGEQDPGHPPLGGESQRRAVLHPGERFLG